MFHSEDEEWGAYNQPDTPEGQILLQLLILVLAGIAVVTGLIVLLVI